MKSIILFVLPLSIMIISCISTNQSSQTPTWVKSISKKIEIELVKKFGQEQTQRIQRGLKQVGNYWRAKDGDANVFEKFILENFVAAQTDYDALFDRFQDHFEKLDGHMDRIVLNFKQQTDLDRGPILPVDILFSGYNPSAHITDDFFNNKLAFIALLNFPLTSLHERSNEGNEWNRRQWAETRLVSRFSKRLPAELSLEISRVSSISDQYISDYNIWMYHVLDQSGKRHFPKKLRLLTHWNLRDEIKAQYAQGDEGLIRQKIVALVMKKIVDQTIPKAVINSPFIDWNPYTNEVIPAADVDSDLPEPTSLDISGAQEPNTRYSMLLENFRVQRAADPYWPVMPNFITRRFDLSREIPEEQVKSMFDEVLSSPLFTSVVMLINKRLGRDLEPFDIWYNGFRPRAHYSEKKLDDIVAKRYPTPESFKNDIPRMLMELGFSNSRSKEISGLITVDPARGSGHAWGPQMRGTRGPSSYSNRIGGNGL